MRDITENADYLLQAIDWINNNKENNAVGIREQNILMGISMGGLVSRYALAKRTKLTNTNTTETKELITMDSPHQGANVPLGLQHFLYDFGEARIVRKIGNISDELKAFYNLNTLTATQQQLILRVTDGNGGREINNFLADGGTYRTMVDYSAPYPFYAISNGSQCAKPVMQPSTLLLKKEGNVASVNWLLFLYNNKYRFNMQVNALPAFGSQSQVCSVVMERNIRLFWGLIGTGWNITSNTPPRISPANTIPWDGVPGGTKTTETTGPISQTSTTPAINQNNTFLGNVWRSIFYLVFNANANIQLPFSQKDFSFVPITSALDVQNVTANTFNQPFNFVTSGLSGSRANKYISQDFAASNLFNIEHTNFTPRNSQWIFNEMQNNPQAITCQDYCLEDLKITPNAGICGSSNTYEIANLPPGASVVWSVTPSGIVSTTALNANPITLTRINEGTITLTANVTLPCSNTPGSTTSTLLFSKVLSVANVGLTGTYVTSQNSSPISFTGNTGIFVQAQRGQYVSISFSIASTQNLTNLRWSNNGYYINGYGNSFSFGINASNYQYSSTNTNIYLYADSPCGPVVYNFYFTVFSSLRMIITASPNPAASGEINIAITKEQETTTRPANFPPEVKAINPYTKITITPINNNVPAKTLLFREDTNTNYKINTNRLTAGTYAITVDRNNIIITTKVIVL